MPEVVKGPVKGNAEDDITAAIRAVAIKGKFKGGMTAADARLITGQESITDEWDTLMPLINQLGDDRAVEFLGKLSTDKNSRIRRTVISTVETIAQQTPDGKQRNIPKDPVSRKAIDLLKQMVDNETNQQVLNHLKDTFRVLASSYENRVGKILEPARMEKLGFAKWD